MRLSVYITSFNQRAYLVEALQSVLAQTRLPDEILVVDDASQDGSQDVIRQYAVRHPGLIKPLLRASNGGIARVRTDALEASTGDAVTYCDGDDRFLPEKLAREAAVLEADASTGLVFSNYWNIDAVGTREEPWVTDKAPAEGDVFAALFGRQLPRRDIFRSELVRTDLLRQVGAYDPALRIYEDFELRVRLMKICRARYVDATLFERRRHGTGLSMAPAAQHLAALRYIYRKHRALLADLPATERLHARRSLFSWMAPFARASAYGSLYDRDLGVWTRRSRALRDMLFCAHYAPDLVTIGDFWRVVLPGRRATRMIDGV